MKPRKPSPRWTVLVACLPLLLAACGGGDPVECTNQGYEALGKGDAAKAFDCFSDALKGLQPSDAGYKRARMGQIEASVRVKPDTAAQSFLAYATDQPDQVEAGDYQKVGMQLSEHKALTEAVAVLDAGLKRFPGEAKLKEAMDKTSAAAQQSGDTSALDALKGLGYVGGGD